MKSKKAVKRRVIAIVVLIVLSFGGGIIYYQYTQLKNLIADAFDGSPESVSGTVSSTFENTLKEVKEGLLLHTNLILNVPDVVKAFSQKDRAKLLSLVAPIYSHMVKENPYIKIMTFRLADGSTFLRVHKPSMYGDPVNSKRKIIIDTNDLKKQHFGFEVGKLKMTYRVVTPIFYDKKHIGLIEIGIEPAYVSSKIADIFNIKNALLVKEETLLAESNASEKNKISDYILVNGDQLFKRHLQEIDLLQKTTMIVSDKKNYIINNNLNLLDHKGHVTAKLLIAHDIDKYVRKVNSMIKDMIINSSLIILVLLIVLNYFINFIVNKMATLNERLALKSGELELLNDSLAHRVDEEVEKNRVKDQLLYTHIRSAQIGEMLNMIAHQWRQPLNAISTSAINISMLQELDILDKDSIIEHAQFVQNTTQLLSKIIDDFINLSKPEDSACDFTFDEMMDEIRSLIGMRLEEQGIQLTNESASEIRLHSYKKELIGILISLISNAKDAYEEMCLEEKPIRMLCLEEDDHYSIHVEDEAGGIPQNTIDKIFNPYFTTKEQGKGIGLGLYMTKRVVTDIFHGEITVSNKNNGAAFVIKIKKERS